MMKIAFVCGHGRNMDGTYDTGATSKRYGTEADLVRKLVPKIKKYLESNYEVKVDLFETVRNWYDWSKHNNRIINVKGYDYYMEHHVNSGGHDPAGKDDKTTGLEAYVTSQEKGITVEQGILKDLQKAFNLKSRGVKRTDFMLIKQAKRQSVSSCLFEHGFIDDGDDMDIITKHLDEYAEVFATSLAKGFNLKRKVKAESKPKVGVYMTSYGNFRFFNIYESDKIERTHMHGLFNKVCEIGTEGARNMFDDVKNGKACGTSHNTKAKGTKVLFEYLENLKFDVFEKIKKMLKKI